MCSASSVGKCCPYSTSIQWIKFWICESYSNWVDVTVHCFLLPRTNAVSNQKSLLQLWTCYLWNITENDAVDWRYLGRNIDVVESRVQYLSKRTSRNTFVRSGLAFWQTCTFDNSVEQAGKQNNRGELNEINWFSFWLTIKKFGKFTGNWNIHRRTCI